MNPETSLAELRIETPSWGYGDSGTRFATFRQPGRPRDVYERIEDAARPPRVDISAVVDAVSHLGIRHIDMPATPERVWQAIRDAS